MESAARRRANVLLHALVIAHLVSTVVALVVLRAFGEHGRLGFFLLYLPRHPFAAAALLLLPIAGMAKKWRLVVVEAATLLLALFPLMGMRVGRAQKPRGLSMRLLTYNVFYARIDQAALTREIVESKADLILLQASRSSYAATLKQAIPDWNVQVDDEFVLATRQKIMAVEFPEPWGDVRQSWVRYSLSGPSGTYQVVNVHPTSARAGLLDREDPSVATALRARQIAAATAAAARATDPMLIAGDTNLPGLSALYRQHLAPFHDAFDDVGFGFGYTFPAKLPWMRIDRVLGGPRVRFLDVRVLPRGASDHRAVVVDFEIAAP
jgi:vancomycin resistance protein VanJ